MCTCSYEIYLFIRHTHEYFTSMMVPRQSLYTWRVTKQNQGKIQSHQEVGGLEEAFHVHVRPKSGGQHGHDRNNTDHPGSLCPAGMVTILVTEILHRCNTGK